MRADRSVSVTALPVRVPQECWVGLGTCGAALDLVSHSSDSSDSSGVLQLPHPFALHHGGELARPHLAWRLAGRRDGPVVAALGGISAHQRVFDLEQPRAGWWCEVAGPGRALDSTRVALLGIDYLGGTGASSTPGPGEPFPSLSSYDQAEALRQLLDHLGIPRLHAIVGASYGGMVA